MNPVIYIRSRSLAIFLLFIFFTISQHGMEPQAAYYGSKFACMESVIFRKCVKITGHPLM